MRKWSLDACVGYAKVNDLFPSDLTGTIDLLVFTNTSFLMIWLQSLWKLKRCQFQLIRPYRIVESFRTDHIEEHPSEASERAVEGH